MSKDRLTSIAGNSIKYGLMVVLALFMLAPFAFMFLISLHPSKAPIPDLNGTRIENSTMQGVTTERKVPAIFPDRAHWENYSTILFNSDLPILSFIVNSVFVSLAVVFGQLIFCSLAAFSFARLRFRGSRVLFNLFLLSMMFSGVVTQIPVYLLVRTVGWLDTYWVLIVPGISSAFSVFLLRQFFAQIPRELDEAARIDGANDLAILWRVILPLSKPVLATVSVFTFVAVWTDFFWPLLATNSLEMRTLEVGLSVFKNSYGATNWPLQMAAAVIVMLPTLVVFVLAQKQFIRGITMGSVKG